MSINTGQTQIILAVFELGVPVLAIRQGIRTMAMQFGGKEQAPCTININRTVPRRANNLISLLWATIPKLQGPSRIAHGDKGDVQR